MLSLTEEIRVLEEEIVKKAAYESGCVQVRTRVPTFPEIMSEWKEGVKKTLSYSYYLRADDTEKKGKSDNQVPHLRRARTS